VTIFNSVSSLFFPNRGVWEGARAIMMAAKFGKNDLQKALRAGALCVVVRPHLWQPKAGEEVAGCVFHGDKPTESSKAQAQVVVK
jgi:hypothetical protein